MPSLRTGADEFLEIELNKDDRRKDVRQGSKRVLVVLISVLIIWALVIAAGSLWMSDKLDFRKPLIVIGTMGTFLGIWLVAFAFRKQRPYEVQETDNAPNQR
jgi:flagellar basal body-associated protein FliL